MYTDSRNHPPSIVSTVENADQKLLLSLLQNAQVSVGHLRGRFISVPGYSGQITFSKFLERVENLYQETLKPMQDRQNQYDLNSTSNIDIMPARGRGGLFINLALMPITLPAKVIGDVVCWTTTPYPEVSEEEEKHIVPMLKWRKAIDAEFDYLVSTSQHKIECLAAKSCAWKIARYWDAFLNTEGACQNIHTNDENTLADMIETRKKRVALQPNMEIAQEVFPAASALMGYALLTYAKYRNPAQ